MPFDSLKNSLVQTGVCLLLFTLKYFYCFTIIVVISSIQISSSSTLIISSITSGSSSCS